LHLKTADRKRAWKSVLLPDNNYGGFRQSASLVAKNARRHRGLHGTFWAKTRWNRVLHHRQRKGSFGIKTPKPVYVVELDGENNRRPLLVGDDPRSTAI